MTPDFRLVAAGRDITAVVRERLVSLTVSDSIGAESDSAEVVLDDADRVIEPPPRGAVLEVEMGWSGLDGGLGEMGRFAVGEVEFKGPPDQLIVRAQAADMLGNLKSSRTKSWTNATLGDLVGAIAAATDLRARIAPALAQLVLPHVDQADESDLGLLRRLAADLDCVIRPAAGALVVIERDALGAGMAPVATIRPGDVSTYSVLLADRDAYGAVEARWGRSTAASWSTVRAGEGGGTVHALPGIYPTEAAAWNAAEARLRELRRSTALLHLEMATGNPALAAELPVVVNDFGAPYDGRWVLSHTSHNLTDADGYLTSMDATRPMDAWARQSS